MGDGTGDGDEYVHVTPFYTMHWKGGRKGTRRSLLRAHTVWDAGSEMEERERTAMGWMMEWVEVGRWPFLELKTGVA